MEINYLQELFFSATYTGWLGAFIIVYVGYVTAKKDKSLGVLWFVVECLFAYMYLDQIRFDGLFLWNSIIVLLGGIMVLVPSLMSK